MRRSAALALIWAGCAADWRRPALRVTLLQSDALPVLDGAGAIDEAELLDRIDAINEIFAAADVRWVVESIQEVPARGEDTVRRALRSGRADARTLSAAVPEDALLTPDGFDLVVVGNTAPFGFGGVFACGAGGDGGPAAAYVPAFDASGDRPQVLRKWAHELGHAGGLGHTDCEASAADRLMMSGTCPLAEPDRVGFSDAELDALRRRLRWGHPTACLGG
jgi:hypothetical protein